MAAVAPLSAAPRASGAGSRAPSIVADCGAAIPADMRAWYTALYGGMGPGHFIEQRYFGADRARTFSATTAEAMAHALARRETSNVYPGMALRGPAEQGGGRANCVATQVLWAEYDLKHGADALAHLRAFGLRLSILVHSGGGLHVQVLLAELLDLTAEEMKARVEAANRHLACALGGGTRLDNVADLPRILRCPASLNHKYDPPRPVELVHLDASCRYTLDEVEAYLRRHHPQPAPEPQPVRTQAQPRAGVARTPAPAGAAVAHGQHADHEQAGAGEEVPPWEDWLAQAPGWAEMLEGDGWHLDRVQGDEELWVRPGKGQRAGHGATLNYAGTGLLYVFTSSVPTLEANRAYDRWAYEVMMRYRGDFREAARAKAEEGYGTLGRYAKEHHGGDLSAAARDLARQRAEKERRGTRTRGGLRCGRPGVLQVVTRAGEVQAWPLR